MPPARTPLLAVVAALGLLGVSYLTAGQGPAGARAAVLNTARWSGLVFAVALVARGFATETAGWRRRLGSQHVALQRAFVGAHFVHFGAVLLLAWLDASHELHRLEPPMLATTAVGFLEVSLVGLTASARADQRARLGLNRAAFYLAWAIFVLAFGAGARSQPPSAAMLGVLVGAMAIRIAYRAASARFSSRLRSRTTGHSIRK